MDEEGWSGGGGEEGIEDRFSQLLFPSPELVNSHISGKKRGGEGEG